MNPLPAVQVTRVEAGADWLVTCTSCPGYRILRHMRGTADAEAIRHRASHHTPVTEDD